MSSEPLVSPRDQPRILLVDDLANTRTSTTHFLTHAGYSLKAVGSFEEALEHLHRHPIDLVLSDVRLRRDDDGLRLLREIKARQTRLPVVLYTGYAQVSEAVMAMKLGAADFLELPIDPNDLIQSVRKALAAQQPSKAARPRPPSGLVAASPAMRGVVEWIERIGPLRAHVLIVGETGTGKELVARALHDTSRKNTGRCVAVNCAAIPAGLFEAELFGYRRGAFTSATSDKIGLIESAHRGTLFLDEVGDLPLSMQAALLRFLEDGEMRRIGDVTARQLDVRVVAATNRPIRDDIARGQFRDDLFYRLASYRCTLPPLRDRIEDLDALIDHILNKEVLECAFAPSHISAGARQALRGHSWPGNVRELQNVLRQLAHLAVRREITEAEVHAVLEGTPRHNVEAPQPTETLDLLAVLQDHRWKIGRAAASLGISRTTLWRKMKELKSCNDRLRNSSFHGTTGRNGAKGNRVKNN